MSVVDGSSGIRYTEEQLAAITAPLEPGVIVAGAGSGKTTVMAARVVWLVEQGLVAPGEVLGLTFTNKAAAELRERVLNGLRQAGLIGLPALDGPGPGGGPGPVTDPDDDAADPAEAAADPVISTYHAYARALIREHGLRLGVEPSTQLLGDARRFTLAAAAVRSAAGPFDALTAPMTDLVRDVIDLDGQLSEHVVEPAALRAHDLDFIRSAERHRKADGSYKVGFAPLRGAVAKARERLELLTLVEDYRAAKRAREVMDFGDQMALGTRLAEQAPQVGRIERGKYRVVLLDEYQDTSVAQRRMLVALFSGEPPGAGGPPDDADRPAGPDAARSGFGHAVTAVGDPCQSIYGWRGASAANIDHFPEHFPRRVRGAEPDTWDRAPARVYTLTENRRSGGRLLSFANERSEVLRAHHTGVSALKPMVEKAELGRSVVAVLPDYRCEVSWIGEQIEALRTRQDESAQGQATPWKQVAVLVRKGAQIPELYTELHGRGIPVEVVGLSGLLHLPEIADLTAMLDVVDDPIANASLVRLLTGPRWRIGPRDLALLGRRARELVRAPDDGAQPAESLEQAAARTDPIDVVSLCDAVEDPGDRLPFSGAALARFERFAAEIRRLRRSLSEPVADLLQRILQETGLDVEIAASPEAYRRRCADTVGAFRSVAANFAGFDGEQSATAFRAFLKACAEHERGLDIDLPPTDADTVKILTMHKAKGLEWDVVAVPHQYAETPKSEPWTGHRSRVPNPLRGDAAELAVLGGKLDKAAFDRFTAEVKAEAALEDDRLSYVTLTRPRAKLIVSAHRWGPSQKTPRKPSGMLERLRGHCEADSANGEVAEWAGEPAEGEENPALAVHEVPWPLAPSGPAVELRRDAARAVFMQLRRLDMNGAATGADSAASAAQQPVESFEDARQQAVADGWDADIEALLDEARRAGETRYEVPMPTSLSATRLLSLAADRRAFAEELFRPMPRPPAPHARRGTEFHAWVEQRFGQQTLFDEEDLDLFADQEEVEGAADLAGLKEAFLRTEYARTEPYRIEAPFQLLLNPPGAAPVIVRGRIDAIYRRPGSAGRDGGYEVVDWKTNRRATADPLQLAIYRIAWAELAGVPIGEVSAAFLYVRTGEIVRPADLPDRAGLEALLAG